MKLLPGMYYTARVTAFVFIFLLAVPFDVLAVTSFLTSGTTYNVPSDWNNSNNQVACVGSGGDGRIGASGFGRAGGGGGAYASTTNVSLTPGGTAQYAVALGGTYTTGTYFDGTSSTSASVSCQSGRTASGAFNGAGGTTAGSIGTTKFAGGNGGSGAFCLEFDHDGEGGGGGGAGGWKAAGAAGSNADGVGNATGGNGDGGFGGAGGSGLGGVGGNGTEFDATHGSGGGGGGGFGVDYNAGDGGTYGGGGGGGGGGSNPDACNGVSIQGAGAQGLIILIYTASIQRTLRLFGNVRLRGVRLSRY